VGCGGEVLGGRSDLALGGGHTGLVWGFRTRGKGEGGDLVVWACVGMCERAWLVGWLVGWFGDLPALAPRLRIIVDEMIWSFSVHCYNAFTKKQKRPPQHVVIFGGGGVFIFSRHQTPWRLTVRLGIKLPWPRMRFK